MAVKLKITWSTWSVFLLLDNLIQAEPEVFTLTMVMMNLNLNPGLTPNLVILTTILI